MSVQGTFTTHCQLAFVCNQYVLFAVLLTACADSVCVVSLASFIVPATLEVAELVVVSVHGTFTTIWLLEFNCTPYVLSAVLDTAFGATLCTVSLAIFTNHSTLLVAVLYVVSTAEIWLLASIVILAHALYVVSVAEIVSVF